MKILFLTTHLNIGGIAVYVASLAKSLAKRAHKITIVSSGGELENEIVQDGILSIKLDLKTKSELSPKLWFNLTRLASVIKREKPDLIHAQTRITQVAGYLLSKRFGIPYVSTCHGFFKPRLSRRLFGCWGDKVIAISEAVRIHLIKDFGVDEALVRLVHNGVDFERFQKSFSEDEIKKTKEALGLGKENIVGTIGRLSSVKGLDNLITAFGNTSLNRKAKLLIVGNGPEKAKLIKTAYNLKLEDRVRFVDRNPDTPKLLAVMDVFAFPSVQEGLGLSLIEAMASGRAVVATDVGGIRSLVKDNETGLLAKKGNTADLARAIAALLDDEGLRQTLGSNSRRLVEKEFTLEKMVDKTEQLYKEVCVI